MGRAVLVAIAGMLGCGRLAFDPKTTQCPDPMVEQGVELAGRFVAPTGGSDVNPGTEAEPWATIAHALAAVGPGETIILMDGMYSERLVLDVSGRTIQAATDGGAVFDGGGTTIPCDIAGTDISLEGVRCRNGGAATVRVLDSANITLRRITADTAPSSNVYQVQRGTDVLLEDVAAWGPASVDYLVIDSSRVTIRRCWGRWEASDDMYSHALMLTDGVFDSTVENCVLTSTAPTHPVKTTVGINLFSTDQRLDRNHLLGNVIVGMPDWGAVVSTEISRIEGNRFIDNVLMASAAGMYQRSDADFGVERLTSVEIFGNGAFVIDSQSTEPKDADFAINGYVRDSVLGVAPDGFHVLPEHVTGFSHTNNILYSIAQPYRGNITADPTEMAIDPAYDKATYGLGAYLIQSSLGVGAEVLARYQDRVLTKSALWPWPMEERIARESGSSVTYESGGGIWRTLPTTPDLCP